MRDNKYALER